jgi:hypothetical protein
MKSSSREDGAPGGWKAGRALGGAGRRGKGSIHFQKSKEPHSAVYPTPARQLLIIDYDIHHGLSHSPFSKECTDREGNQANGES